MPLQLCSSRCSSIADKIEIHPAKNHLQPIKIKYPPASNLIEMQLPPRQAQQAPSASPLSLPKIVRISSTI